MKLEPDSRKPSAKQIHNNINRRFFNKNLGASRYHFTNVLTQTLELHNYFCFPRFVTGNEENNTDHLDDLI